MSALYEISFDNITEVSNNNLFKLFHDSNSHNIVKREEGTPRSCSDPLSFASFLAFALAVSNLMMGKKRKKRSVVCNNKSIEKQNLTLATSTVIHGIVASQHVIDEKCQTFTNCWIGEELSKLGKVGKLMAKATHLFGSSTYDDIQVKFYLTIF